MSTRPLIKNVTLRHHLLLLGAFVITYLAFTGWRVESPLTTESPEIQGSMRRPVDTSVTKVPPGQRLRTLINSDDWDFQEFLQVVDQLHQEERLFDNDIQALIYNICQRASIEQLATLLKRWPNDGPTSKSQNIFGKVAGILGRRQEINGFLFLLNDLPTNLSSTTRERFILSFQRRCSIFSAAKLPEFFLQIPKKDYPIVAELLVNDIRRREGEIPPDKLVEQIEQATALTDSTEFIGPLFSLRVELFGLHDPEGTLKWATAQDQKTIGSFLDESMLPTMYQSSAGLAVEYLNHVLSSGNGPRGDRAFNMFVNIYSRDKPIDAMQWLLRLPANSSPPKQTFVTAFGRLFRSNPNSANSILKDIEDPEIRDLLEDVKRTINSN